MFRAVAWHWLTSTVGSVARKLYFLIAIVMAIAPWGVRAQNLNCIYNNYRGATVLVEYQYKASSDGVVDDGAEKGSGFIVSPDGYMLTNAHVVTPDETTNITSEIFNVRVKYLHAQPVIAELIARDYVHDLALLKLSPPKDGTSWLTMPVSNKTTLDVGSTIAGLAFSPGDAALIPPGTKTTDEAYIDDKPVPWWQTSLNVTPGNSGGPIFSSDGTVVGIAVALNRNSQAVSYVIPIALARDLIARAGARLQEASECAAR